MVRVCVATDIVIPLSLPSFIVMIVRSPLMPSPPKACCESLLFSRMGTLVVCVSGRPG